jgi:glycosyltransferase involved in cell wall biosynthesis
MKVLVVSEPGLDGVFRHVEGLIRYLLDHGHEVLFAWSDRRTSDRLITLVEEVNKRGGATLRLSIGNGPAPGDLSALLKLAAFARRHGPDLIHAHSSKAGALTRVLPLLGVKATLLYTPHAYYRMHDRRGWKTHFFHLIEAILGHVGWTTSLSPSEAEFAARHLHLPPARLVRIQNGVDPVRFTPAPPAEKTRLRAELGIPPGARVLGTLGRFSAQKDPVTLYRALGLVARDLPDLFFVHLGKGELEPEVEAVVKEYSLADRVRRVPYLPDPLPIYRCLDGFILTSLYEGMSYALLEALALDLPLVLTRAPGVEEFADMGLSHLSWAQPGDAASVAAAIREWHGKVAAGAPPNHREIAINSLSEEKCFGELCRMYALVSAVTPDPAAHPVPAPRL